MFKRLILVLVLCALSVCSVSAHPGRTDSDGGHRDHSTGEYHYHHGYAAHQHTDGICPYDFDDKTGWNNGTSSSNSDQSPMPIYRPVPPLLTQISSDNKQVDIKKESNIIHVILKIITSLLILLGLIYMTLGSIIVHLAYSGAFLSLLFSVLNLIFHLLKKIVIIFSRILEIPQYFKKQRAKVRLENEHKAELISMYGGKSLAECSGMPPDVEIGSDGLPKECGADDWGQRYTFYISPKGKSYHCRRGCSNAQIPIHAFTARWKYSPCKRCTPQLPDLEWYTKYKQIERIKQNYNID